MTEVRETFEAWSHSRWRCHVTGAGSLEATGSTLRFTLTNASPKQYANAQIDDYQGLSRHRFLWRPPLRLTVRARFSAPAGQLQGTAGFGFWNDPFMMTGRRWPSLPRAIWYFYASPPSNMKLDVQTPGYGWKAATIDALHLSALLWAPAVPLAVPLMNLRQIHQALWPPIQRALKAREATLAIEMTHWHTYVLEWGTEHARFSVSEDGTSPFLVLDAPSPSGPLGFVMWLDNQYLVATPWGKVRWGLLEVPARQWMEVDWLAIEPLKDGMPG
jgi:hypothetical protein